MIRKIIKVSDNNFRKFDDPLGNETPRKYIFYAKTCDVPEGIPMSTNPRDQKLKYKWMDGKDPIAVWNKHKVGLTRSVMDLAGSLGDKPTVFGKDPSLWNYAYMVLSSMEGISLV